MHATQLSPSIRMDSPLENDAPNTSAVILDANRQPTAWDVLYTFLHECSRASIAELCSSLKVPRWGTKVIMEDRVYRVLCLRLPRSQIASEADFAGLPLGTVSTKRSATMTEFIAAQQQQGHPKMVPWRRAPADDLEVPAQPGDERRNSDAAAFSDRENVDEVRAAATRRVRDFARLIGILSGDAEVRTALIDSALSRTRA
jgi:hypothetical protein